MMNASFDERVERVLSTYQNKRTFTGCAAAVSMLDADCFIRRTYYRGCVDDTPVSLPVDKYTFFDLASLTKPFVTVLCLLSLVKDGKVSWEDRLDNLLPMVVPEDKKKIRVIDLICHRSGLPAHRPYFQRMDSSSDNIDISTVVSQILQEKLEDFPQRSYLYSDLDYLLLGYLVEYISAGSLAKYWYEKIADPLKISDQFYMMGENEKDKLNPSFAVTGKCLWTNTTLAGIVHDDNCRALGKICGHAGLFATLTGVLELSETLLLNYKGVKDHPSYRREDLLYLLKERNREQWACGFDVPTGEKSSCGKYFSKRTIGHLGFSGTSFWIDLINEKVAVVLTNRVIYGNDNNVIRELRPELHDTLLSPRNWY